MKVDALQKEHENGFCTLRELHSQRIWAKHATVLPDLSKQDNIDLLQKWEGSWTSLSSLSWVRFSKTGSVKPSTFPPSGR